MLKTNSCRSQGPKFWLQHRGMLHVSNASILYALYVCCTREQVCNKDVGGGRKQSTPNCIQIYAINDKVIA